ncbi:hypothetical protein CPK_ORF01039 [Chlamydia pneumoniae LPCoLN]|nr:hypothetical protein CPK_ORF01039 [Chlamydia pneumoniae LPCoLN]
MKIIPYLSFLRKPKITMEFRNAIHVKKNTVYLFLGKK